jgi:hypothetical protein
VKVAVSSDVGMVVWVSFVVVDGRGFWWLLSVFRRGTSMEV